MTFAASRFAENGFHPTSVAEIVEGLGVGKGVFYWYFDTKEDLFRAILADAQLDLRRRQQAALDTADTPVARIEQGIRASIEWSLEHAELFRLFQFAATDERFSAGLAKGQRTAVRDAARQIREAIDAGAIAPADPEVLAHAMLGVSSHLVQMILQGVLSADGAALDAIIDTTVGFCLYGTLGVRDR